MSFLVLVLVLVIEKFSALRHRLQGDRAWLAELARLEAKPRLAKEPALILALWVLLPAVVLGALLLALKPVAYGLFALPIHLLVVIYSLGRGDVKAGLGPFRDAWRRGDEQAAVHVAERDLGLSADDESGLLAKVQDNLLWQAYQSFFAVIFWYVLLGPVAALVYRLLALAVRNARHPGVVARAGSIRHAFDWLPVRVLAVSFALVGNFVAVGKVMLHEVLHWGIGAKKLIADVGRVAGELPATAAGEAGVASLDSLWELLLRSAVLWYAVIALWTVLF
ncbi:regulatory signaling modulator protein AmpE [Pseudomonas silvicola]|uniref:regulatory signaling modulator protein AmpE n=1 Tax=Pseudomonas sp. RIT-To-2 TaxID=3462541 RepID=UPI00227B0DCE|nr:regulatory signaling modulator protein AmpE [Pseudomonas silvicola]